MKIKTRLNSSVVDSNKILIIPLQCWLKKGVFYFKLGDDKMKRVGNYIFLTLAFVVLSSLIVVSACHQEYGKGPRQAKKIVEEILTAKETRTQIPYVTKTYRLFSVEQAYEIQDLLTNKLRQKMGGLAGYKVAYASKAAQKQFGVDEPARGPFFMVQRLSSGSKIPVEEFNEITIETEVAFTLGRRIDKPVKDIAALKPFVKWVHTAFDAGDFPYTADPENPTPQDMIAAFTGAHLFVLGPAVEPEKVNIDTAVLRLARNGQTIRQSAAANVMGSPWNSLLWLVNHVVKHGGVMEPGYVVLTGTAAPAYKAKGDDIKGHYEGDCGALGNVSLTVY
jgi:2-keto-4-pentenoate hydratase